MIHFLSHFSKIVCKRLVVHHSTRIRCVGKQVCLYSLATQKDSRKCSVHFRKRTFLCNIWKQQVSIIGDAGVESISRALKTNTSLKSPCYFGCVVLFKHLSHTTANRIGASGAESISRALQSNTSLTSLNISSVLFC